MHSASCTRLFCVVIVLQCQLQPSSALDNGLGRTPPMGWASWNTFVDVALNESVIRETADAIVASGLKDLGYEYVNVDCGWSAVNRTASGQIQPDPDRFPTGMAALSEYIHNLGLKFGLYTARGPVECCGRTGYNGSVHAAKDAASFAKWKVDYLKVDSCGADGPGTEWEQFAAMRDALNATGRPVYLSICEITEDEGVRDGCLGRNIVYSPKMWFGQGKDVATLGNSILVEYSNNGNSFQAVKCTMEAQQRLTFDNLTRPGSWNDNDMLTVGCTDHHVNEPWTPCINKVNPKTHVDGRSEFNLFVIQASPLILGNDVRHMSPETMATLSNREALAVNQDPLGHRGERVHFVNNSVAVYVKALALSASAMLPNATNRQSVRRAIAVFNLGETRETFSIQGSWLGSGHTDWTDATLRDLWAHAPATPSAHVAATGTFKATLEPHASLLYSAVLT